MSFNYVPSQCPICSSPLSWKNHDLYCTNPDCSRKASANLYHWMSNVGRRGLLGIGDSLISSIVEFYGWNTLQDIYSSPIEIDSCEGMTSMEGIGESKIMLIKQVLRNLLKEPQSFTGFMASLNIKGISYTIGHLLEVSSNLEECLKNNTKDIFQYNGNAVKQSILDNWNYILRIYRLTEKLHLPSVKPTEDSPKEDNRIKVCITGKANDGLTRSQFYEKYKSHIVESSVSSCDYLVCNAASNSSKIKTAKAKGIKVITENELQDIIG